MSEAKTTESNPSDTISGPGASAGRRLKSEHREQGHIQEQAREDRGNRRRTLGVRIGQPCVQRHEPHLRSVAEQEEHERKVEERRIETGRILHEHVPGHGIQPFAEDRVRRQIHQDGPE
jgi:hypothetical protein